MSKPQLILPGKYKDGGLLTFLDDKERIVRGLRQQQYLFYLMIAAYEGTPYLLVSETVLTNGDPDRTRKIVDRLRAPFEPDGIVGNGPRSGPSCYLLALEPDEILICPPLWKLPFDDDKLLRLLRVAHDNYWRVKRAS